MRYPRFIESALQASLSDTPVVLLNGARQVGKTTLVRHLAASGWGGGEPRYVTLDDTLSRAQAERDPDRFLQTGNTPLLIDEVQLVPDLLRAIKRVVDNDRRPGQFLLTGSSDVFTLPTASESLAGRMAIKTLRPLAAAEIAGVSTSLVDRLFSDEPLTYLAAEEELPLFEQVAIGGYPESLRRKSSARREEWFEDYVTTILGRDIRDLASIERLSDIPRLLRLMAARTATLANYSEYSRALGIPNSSLKRYLTLLKATFLVQELPAWSANLSKRLVRSPKIYLSDTGLAAALTGFDPEAIHTPMRGPLLETWIINEIEKHVSWADLRTSLYHFRTHSGHEVDLLLEDRQGRLVAIETKSRTTLQPRDFKGLEKLRDALPEQFHRGVVFYAGEEVREYSEGIVAVPVGIVHR